jgi:hypothetical protein
MVWSMLLKSCATPRQVSDSFHLLHLTKRFLVRSQLHRPLRDFALEICVEIP